MKKQNLVKIFAAAMMIAPCAGFGAAFQMYDIDSADTLGLAGAVSARSDIVANAWHNPAATAWFERPTVQVSAALIKMDSQRHGVNGVTSDFESDSYEAFPSVFYIQPVNSELSFTLAVNGAYGMATHWNEDTWGGSQSAHYPVMANMAMGIYPVDTFIANIYVTPSLVYKITDDFGVSLGVNIVGGMVNATKRNMGEDYLKVETQGLGLGWTASAFWNINEFWSVGAKYQSDVLMKYDGHTSADGTIASFEGQDVHTELRLPQSFTFGIVNRSFDNLTLSADIVWTDWSSMNNFWFEFDNVTYTEAKNWKSVVSYRLGAEYALNENWVVRCGYAYDNSPISTHGRSAELPGSDYHQISVGFGYKIEAWSFDVAYSYWAYETSRDGDGSRYTNTSIQVLSTSVTYRF